MCTKWRHASPVVGFRQVKKGNKVSPFGNCTARDISPSQPSAISEGMILSERGKQNFCKEKKKNNQTLPPEQKEKEKSNKANNLEFSVLAYY